MLGWIIAIIRRINPEIFDKRQLRQHFNQAICKEKLLLNQNQNFFKSWLGQHWMLLNPLNRVNSSELVHRIHGLAIQLCKFLSRNFRCREVVRDRLWWLGIDSIRAWPIYASCMIRFVVCFANFKNFRRMDYFYFRPQILSVLPIICLVFKCLCWWRTAFWGLPHNSILFIAAWLLR